MNNISTVILAAGKSTRYKRKTTKLLEDLAGLPLISHVHKIGTKISGKNVIIVCNRNNIKEFKKIITGCKFVIQNKQKGTADAISCAKPYLKSANFLILFGDAPLISLKSINKLVLNFKKNNSIASMIAFNASNPIGYGRVKKQKDKVLKVVEEINTTSEEKKINLCNSGVMIVNSKNFFQNLDKIKTNKLKNEKYLPDIFEIYNNLKIPFSYIISPETEMLGVNTIEDFVKVDRIYQKYLVNNFISKGVLIQNPDTCSFSFDTIIQSGAIIESNVVIKKGVKILKDTIIKSFSYLEGVIIRQNASIGPFARIRPNTIISKNVKIGNYVEVKNSYVGDYSSVSHLSYIGDAKIGKKVNVGAGTITCNYDGKQKNKTIIRDGAFIGSNSSLIAPIIINKNAKIAAGSVINKNIPSNYLAIERSKLKLVKKN